MLRLVLAVVLIGYLPGALLFRWPVANRDRRAAIGADERVFWYVILSVAWSLAVVLSLAALDLYRFDWLLGVNSVFALVSAGAFRGRLRYGPAAARPAWTVLLPIALLALGVWRFFPSAEYIIGGKDPGVYISEGIQLAKQGSLVIREPIVAAVPAGSRDLFFPSHKTSEYYGNRFMGFFLQDPAAGQSVGQFPHLYPASIAIGYAIDGLTGARGTVGVWAILGLLAVYFAGARLMLSLIHI